MLEQFSADFATLRIVAVEYPGNVESVKLILL
jgi:hypothetical protein